jgi:hypothetical protein
MRKGVEKKPVQVCARACAAKHQAEVAGSHDTTGEWCCDWMANSGCFIASVVLTVAKSELLIQAAHRAESVQTGSKK